MAGQTYETPLAGGVSREANQKLDSAIIGKAADMDKAFATLRAKFALLGHTLTVEQRGGQTIYIVGRWGQSRVFAHLHDLRAFYTQIGGPQ